VVGREEPGALLLGTRAGEGGEGLEDVLPKDNLRYTGGKKEQE